MSALAAGARLEKDKEALRALRLAMEQAVAQVSPDDLRQISWQGVSLAGADLSGRKLDGLDLRDANLEDANLSGTSLAGSKLAAARLNGARMDKAVLQGAELVYADLAGANLNGADLRRAQLDEMRVLRMDLEGADLRGARFDADKIRWDMIDNWRRTRLDDGLMDRLIDQFGPEPAGPRVMMLLWEAPPMVAGGTWTACFHLVRNLKRAGAKVTVVVPWKASALLPLPFDTDIEILSMGIEPPQLPAASERTPSWSPYSWLGGGPQPPQRSASTYGVYGVYGVYGYGPYDNGMYGASAYAAPGRGLDALSYGGSSGLFRLMELFREKVFDLVATRSFDIVHAHDWVTFPAGEQAASALGIPWIAHFHSSEGERHPDNANTLVQRLEREALETAQGVVTPSAVTAANISSDYGIDRKDISIVPNSLSPEEIPSADMGRFERQQIVFLGRLTRQKGPDYFVDIARTARAQGRHLEFVAYGEGDMDTEIASSVRLLGPLDWGARGSAFRDATAIIVPSRAEPFGMVILEAMQHKVPVLYSEHCGAAEVLESGIPIDPTNPDAVTSTLIELIDDIVRWETVVGTQTREISGYADRGYETKLMQLWAGLASGVARDRNSA